MPRIIRQNATLVVLILYVVAVALCSYVSRTTSLAIYGLSFWHYYLYGLAYVLGAVRPATFKRDAIFAKSISIAILASLYLSMPLDAVSLATVALGFLLNISAAAALGSDRTYYGYELGNLPALQVTSFPYSITAHPMLIGNIAAFGGTLLNEEFRAHWWPLAVVHVALNIGLLIMEVGVTPRGASLSQGRNRPTAAPHRHNMGLILCVVLGAILGATLAGVGGLELNSFLGAAVGASAGGTASFLQSRYSTRIERRGDPFGIIVRSVP